jgi:hypothetical protein
MARVDLSLMNRRKAMGNELEDEIKGTDLEGGID